MNEPISVNSQVLCWTRTSSELSQEESVVQFDSSGLLHRGDDSVHRPKMTID